jgi:capsular exopolysaccharide synthesis family protein
MSRFYNALKEAGRSTGAQEGIPPKSEWDAQGLPVSEVPAHGSAIQLEQIDAGPEQKTPELQSEALHADLLHMAGIPARAVASPNDTPQAVNGNQAVVPPVPTSDAASQNGAGLQEPESSGKPTDQGVPPAESKFQAKTEITFDPSARLIPQAADSAVVEHYRRLRTKILQQHAVKPFQILMVSSPSPQEGKTVTVLNLGLSFAMLPNFRVLVVDGDLRRGTIGKWLGADDYPGLSNVLEGGASLEDVAIKCANVSMHVVTRGNSEVSPAELLHSPRLNEQFRRMTEHFDLVLVDSPPVTLITDAQLLAGSCDAVLLIARAFRTKRRLLEQAVQDLNSFRVIGTVLNGGTRAQLYHGYHSGYY